MTNTPDPSYATPSATFTCPTEGDPAMSGCGKTFDAEPDYEGLVDCPHCGMWFPATDAYAKPKGR